MIHRVWPSVSVSILADNKHTFCHRGWILFDLGSFFFLLGWVSQKQMTQIPLSFPSSELNTVQYRITRRKRGRNQLAGDMTSSGDIRVRMLLGKPPRLILMSSVCTAALPLRWLQLMSIWSSGWSSCFVLKCSCWGGLCGILCHIWC